MARRKDQPNNAYNKSTRFAQYEQAKKARASVLKLRGQIPWLLGPNTYIYAAIAANGGVLRQTDILVSFGGSANRINEYDAKFAGMLRTFQLRTQQGRGPRGLAVMFDERFPLYKEVFALARTIGELHPIPVENNMPDEKPAPPSSPASHNIDLLAGSEVNTLVLATVRALRGRAGLQQLRASVPYGSLTAVERAVQRLREYGILEGGDGEPIRYAAAPWTRHIEKLYDGYLRLRPELRDQIKERSKAKQQRRDNYLTEALFGYEGMQQILTTLAERGPMPRTELRSITMFNHQNKALLPLEKAGIVTFRSQKSGTSAKDRERLWVSLNAAHPLYKELRATLFALAGTKPTRVTDFSDPRPSYDAVALFKTETMLDMLLMINAVKYRENDAASIHRLRGKHAEFTIHQRMKWLIEHGFVTDRREGFTRYYRLDPSHPAHKELKRLLNKIGRVWPKLVARAQYNEVLKDPYRRKKDRKARAQSPEKGGIPILLDGITSHTVK